MDLFNVHTIFFTFLGYDMSYLEFFGTLFNIAAVWFAVRNNIFTWIATPIAVSLFFMLFYQYQLYSDMMIQVFYFGTGVAGLWTWARHKKGAKVVTRPITRTTMGQNLAIAAGVALGTLALGIFMKNIHTLLPGLFPKPAAYPFVDALITVGAIIAQLLLVFRKLENWHIWIVVDVIAVGVYYSRGVKLVALLYVIFLILAVVGLIQWRKQLNDGPEPEPVLKEKTV
jgi:nicotinamide mononucleotide transporter